MKLVVLQFHWPFKGNFTINRILQAKVWLSQSKFTTFYLRDVIRKPVDAFSIGPGVVAEEVIKFTEHVASYSM